jgi:rhodanese-related sulfurtransferase
MPSPGCRRRPPVWLVLLSLLAVAGSGCATVRKWQQRRRAASAPYKVVLPAIAYEIIRDNGGILILDLRSAREFSGATGHLRGAVNIPLADLPYRLIEISSYRGETFLVYCASTPCAEAGMAVLLSSGFDDGVLIEGGIDAWIRAGFKTFLPASDVGRVRPARVPGLSPGQPRELPVMPPEPPPATPPPPPASPPPADRMPPR